MQKVIHRAHKRGVGEYGWLSTRYSFSFADWYDPTKMGFGALRVLNDDTIAPASGFGMHSHRDMEIITIVTSGAVTHEDDMGNKGTVPAGDVQVMSAGTGVTHAEHNRSPDEPLTLLQLWIEPRKKGGVPHYAQKSFDANATLLVSPHGQEGSLSIGQDAFVSRVAVPSAYRYTIQKTGNGVYLFVLTGEIVVDGVQVSTRDALGVTETDTIVITSPAEATVLMIEVPMT